MRQHQRLRVRLRLRLGLALRLKRSIALGLSIDRLGALLRLSLGALYLRTSPPPAMASGEMQFQGAFQEPLEDVLEEFDTDLAMLGVSCSEHTGAQGLQSLRCVQVAQGLKTLRAVLDGLTITEGNLMGAICSEHTIATYRAAVTKMLCLILLSAGALGLQSPGGDASDVFNHAI